MGIPEIVLSDQDLDALEEIKAKADTSRQAQQPQARRTQPRAEAPELGNEQIDISMMEGAG